MTGRPAESDEAPVVAGILLAAGGSTRFGQPKLLAEVGAVSLLVLASRKLAAVCNGGVWVVIGAAHSTCADALANEPVRTIYNPAWREGMAASLRQGLAAMSDGADAFLLALADQPAITVADLSSLIEAWRIHPDEPAAAEVAGMLMAPAVVPAKLKPQLMALRGDAGARSILRDAPAVSRVAMPSASVDIDTPDDLKRYVAQAGLSPGDSSV